MAYSSTQAHLLDELRRIDAILNVYNETQQAGRTDERPEIEPQTVVDEPSRVPLALPEERRAEISTLTDRIEQQCNQTESVTLRLRVLAETFDLSRRQLDVLLLALAPRVDEDYTQQFERLHETTALSRLTVILVEKLFSRTSTEAVTAGGLLGSDSPLRQHNLLKFMPAPDGYSSERGRLITVPDRIVDYLKGSDGVDPGLKATLAEHSTTQDTALIEREATTTLSELTISDDLSERLDSCSATAGSRRYYWYGPAGTEKHRAVETLCSTDQYLKADLRAVLEAGALEWLSREAALLGRPLHLTHATAAVTNHGATNTTLESVFNALSELAVEVFVTGSDSWTPSGATTDVDEIIEFPYPSIELRQQFWESHSAELPADVDPAVLAGTFRLTHGQLRAALSTAQSLADNELTPEDIYAGCSAQSADDLSELAERIDPDSNWGEIQLRAKTKRKLRLVRTHIKQQATIYSDWGFAEQFSRGTGVVALFEGPSGTGKTMAAEILAGDVGMDLYRIDLSSVVSKYIGETEENLEEIFEAATNSNAVLLFDEADAVFGDRAQVSDATDRYANAEVNYLLQRIESYDGIVLLTTNYSSNIDSAFQRRIDHTVSFKQPQQDTRNAIWQEIFPDDAPLGEIDYDFLSSFKFTGGQIKTIGQTAAILAAEDEGDSAESTIEMEHLIQAVQLEFDENGRVIDPSRYEGYQELLYDESEATDVDQMDLIDGETVGDTGSNSAVGIEGSSEHDGTLDSQATDEQAVGSATKTEHDSEVDPADNSDVSDLGVGSESDDEPPSPERTPEEVVRAFVDRLSMGDMKGVNELYHSNATVDRFSRKDLMRLKQGDLSIVSEFKRIREDSSRVVVEFVQEMNGTEEAVSYELRVDDSVWQVFNIQRTSNKHTHVD
jgi:SpoVK/Ycf46/Vps4 family AAA+-type ATPase